MLPRILFALLLFIGGGHPAAFAQTLLFDHLNVENGLSQNSVLAITQDARGFMWFGTRYGLNRYDGHNFHIYKALAASKAALPDNYVTALLCDSHHTLWVGTTRGLNKYDPVNDTFQYWTVHSSLPYSEYSINCIYEDKKGNIWVGTTKGLLRSTDPGHAVFSADGYVSRIPGIAGSDILAIHTDYTGAGWIGTPKGLIRLDTLDGRVQTFVHDNKRPGSLSDSYVTSIIEDNAQTLWIGTLDGGLNRYHPHDSSFSAFTHANTPGIASNNIRSIVLDKKGKLWIGTLEGLSILDPKNSTCRLFQEDPENKKSLSQNSIHSIYRDVAGSIWMGTYFGGVNVTYSFTTPFMVYQNSKYHSSIDNNVVSSITEDDKKNLVIATEGGGLNYYDRKSGLFTAYKYKPDDPRSIGSNLVKVLYKDRSGHIWLGTHDGGLNLFDPVGGQFTRYPRTLKSRDNLGPEIQAVLQDSEGRLWVGTQDGPEVFRINGDSLEPYPLPTLPPVLAHARIHSLIEDRQGLIWMGTAGGIFVISPRLELLHSFQGGNGLTGAYTNCIKEDSKGRIWIGFYYGGLALYHPATQSFTMYTEKDGMPNSNVLGILEDSKGNLWISTDDGLSRFDAKGFRNYTSSDGLAGNTFNNNSFFKDDQGKMYFGGYNGFTTFFPDSIETNDYIAPMVLTSLKLFNIPVGINGRDHLLTKDIGLTRQITFHHDQNVFSLDFALLNYAKSAKNRYQYILEGFDKDWNEVGNASATYTNLPPGYYTFRVKGANNDGVWSAPAELLIRILPPWWATWWAYLAYILFLAIVLFFVTRFFFLRALLKRDHELHQVKLNFFTNISHEIRTHLTLISGPVEKMIQLKKEDTLLHHQLQHVKTSADRLLRLVEELMDFRKAETNHLKLHLTTQDLVAFVHSVYTSFRDLSLSRRITLDFTADPDNIAVPFDKEQMEKVFYNLLTNAFKFTPDGGHIRVDIEQKTDTVDVRVTDNGKGIAPENVKKLFVNFFQVDDHNAQNTGYGIGLAFSKSIVKLHKGDLTVESELAALNRTCFTVTLPLERIQQPPSGTGSKGRYSLLLVEDNADVRSFIVESLSAHYQVTACAGGLQGWETAIEQIPDLIISDVMMPEMDGLVLCRHLKTDQRTSHIPVILLTAKAAHEHQVSGLQTGADMYIIKPFSIEVLELHIHNLIASREAMRQKFTPQVVLQPHHGEGGVTGAGITGTGASGADMEQQFLEKLTRLIEDNIDNPEFAVPFLSSRMGMSQPVLYKKVKAVTNLSVNDFIKFMRLQKAAQMLHDGRLTIQYIAGAVGYTDSKYFSKEFKKQFGKTPSEYARDAG
jgi:ligand-binding sensor domain-containing protein/signal transduction histidine kinase/AraC-like DNA-binding protein/ActR/RegA family two-component response regulator